MNCSQHVFEKAREDGNVSFMHISSYHRTSNLTFSRRIFNLECNSNFRRLMATKLSMMQHCVLMKYFENKNVHI